MSDFVIEFGDYVDVFFEHLEPEFNLKVLHSPQDTGDSWRFIRYDGTMVYIQSFSKMIRVARVDRLEKK